MKKESKESKKIVGDKNASVKQRRELQSKNHIYHEGCICSGVIKSSSLF